MAFKINISEKEKTFHLEADAEFLVGMKIGEKFSGEKLSSDFNGYEFEVTGTSDKSGFPGLKNVEGSLQKRLLLGYGKGMHKKSKGVKKKGKKIKGLRLKKTVRGNTISTDIALINLNVLKAGSKKLEEIYPEQGKKKEKAGEKKEEVKEEGK